MKQSARGFLTALFLSSVATVALAELPQSGLWAIDGEVNGKPGRGIQIDRQNGNLLVISYFGYRFDGSATFSQAVGNVAADERTFSAELKEYKNGPALGGAISSGELAKVIGTVKMEFDTSTSGSIQFPGEQSQSISRFTFDDHRNRLNHPFRTTMVALSEYETVSTHKYLTFKQSADQLEFEVQDLNGPDASCVFKGDLLPRGDGFTSIGSYACVNPVPSPGAFYRLESLKVDSWGFLSGTLYTSAKQDLSNPYVRKFFGICVNQNVDVSLPPPGTEARCK